jgi:DNA polymerase III epsilon subunit-like protein
VSIGWALFRGAESKLKHHYTIIRPDGFMIPSDAARVHRITTERALREGAPLRATLASLLQDVDMHRPDLVVAHNMDFDRPILLAEFLRAGFGDSFVRLPTFCTMATTTEMCGIPRAGGGYKWPTLDELHRHLFGTGVQGAHDAGADVLSCAKCYFKLQQMGLTSDGTTTSYSNSMPHTSAPSASDDNYSEANDLIERIMDWAESNPDFDTDFVEKLADDLETKGRLTQRQIDSLHNIIERWRVD